MVFLIHSDIIWPLGAQQFKLTRKPLRPHCIYRLFELDTHINALPQQLMRQKVWRQQEKLVMARYFNIKVGLRLNVWSSINEFETMWVLYVWRKKNLKIDFHEGTNRKCYLSLSCKFHIFWEGHKILQYLHLTWLALHNTKVRWRFHKILWPS